MARKRNSPSDPLWWIEPLLLASVAGAAVVLGTSRARAATPPPAPSLPPPARPRTPLPATSKHAPTSTTPMPPATGFAATLVGLSPSNYLRAVEAALLAGHVPASQAVWRPVQTRVGTQTGTFYVLGLPLACGTDADAFHAAIPVGVAQRVADHLGAMLPTRRMVDLIHEQADVRVAFKAYTSARDAVSTFLASSAVIEGRRAGRGGLVSDYGKDYVLSNQRRGHEDKITIYGAWESATGAPVQPYATPHSVGYYDYSQHARMVRNTVLVNGAQMSLAAALANPATAPLFSSEGTITGSMLRYPT